MKVKEIKVVVRPLEEDLEEVVDAFRKVEGREEFKDEKIVVDNLDDLRKILTPERIRILQVIKNRKPNSIYELSKLLERDRSAVMRDLEFLSKLGFVEFKEERWKKRKSKKPIVPYDEIEVSIPVII
ncbi:MAG: HTH domain-containing protein [Archaeoglobus sp.]|nr:HTH domain-containing protein [Archaeoglobus sp.]